MYVAALPLMLDRAHVVEEEQRLVTPCGKPHRSVVPDAVVHYQQLRVAYENPDLVRCEVVGVLHDLGQPLQRVGCSSSRPFAWTARCGRRPSGWP